MPELEVAFAAICVILVVGLGSYLVWKSLNNNPVSTTSTLFTGKTRVYNSYGTVLNARLQENSNNRVGVVLGRFQNTGLFEMIINFSEKLPQAPTAVILTIGLAADGMPYAGYTAFVDNITQNGFEVIGLAPSAQVDNILFYYLVV
jgi:hypothetical protein